MVENGLKRCEFFYDLKYKYEVIKMFHGFKVIHKESSPNWFNPIFEEFNYWWGVKMNPILESLAVIAIHKVVDALFDD